MPKRNNTDQSDDECPPTSIFKITKIYGAHIPKSTVGGKTAGKVDEKTVANVLSELHNKAQLEGLLTTADFSPLTVKDLKGALKLNDRSCVGNRDALIQEIIACMTHGRPPRCPKCAGGRLRWGERFTKVAMVRKDRFWCPGYYDDAEQVRCNFNGDLTTVTLLPWKCQ